MARSFGIVEEKLLEVDFFLEKIKVSSSNEFSWSECHFYFSAFLSSARSITFALQASISGNEEMKVWYKEKQEISKKDKEAGFFVEARNLSQKIGYYPITGEECIKMKMEVED